MSSSAALLILREMLASDEEKYNHYLCGEGSWKEYFEPEITERCRHRMDALSEAIARVESASFVVDSPLSLVNERNEWYEVALDLIGQFSHDEFNSPAARHAFALGMVSGIDSALPLFAWRRILMSDSVDDRIRILMGVWEITDAGRRLSVDCIEGVYGFLRELEVSEREGELFRMRHPQESDTESYTAGFQRALHVVLSLMEGETGVEYWRHELLVGKFKEKSDERQ